MTFASDIADDASLFDGTQTVTLRTPGGDSASVDYVSDGVWSYSQMVLVGGVAPEAQLRSFSLPVSECGGLVPIQDSEIVDADGVIWSVKNLDSRTLTTRYKCACVRVPAESSAPFAPVSLADNSSSGGVLRLAWTNRNGADTGLAGRVEYAVASDFTAATAITISSVSGASVALAQAITPGTYYVRVRHSNANGNSPWSSAVQVTVGA